MGQEKTFARARQATSSISSRPSNRDTLGQSRQGQSALLGNLVHRMPQFALVAAHAFVEFRKMQLATY
jgi:hypothetical protein